MRPRGRVGDRRDQQQASVGPLFEDRAEPVGGQVGREQPHALPGPDAPSMGAGLVAPQGWVVAVAGGALVVAGVARLVRQRHPRWVGMRVGFVGLMTWSALMATAHGAGLMVLPFVLPGAGVAAAHCHL